MTSRKEVGRKPYEKPELVRYGTIEALTAGASGNGSDGAVFSNVSM